jgi:cytochrome c2
LRRYIPTLLGLAVLLGISGVAVFLQSTGAQPDPMLVSIGAILAGLAALVVVSAVLGIVINLVAALASAKDDPVARARAKPEAPAKGSADVPLSDDRSLTIFYVVIGVAVLGFLVVRALAARVPPGYPLDRLPDFSTVLFTTPGEAIPGWPGFVPGPGQDVTAAMLFFGIIPALVVGTLVTGVVMAQVFKILDKQVKAAEKASAPEKPAGKTGPAARPAEGSTLPVPLMTDRSVAIFFIVIGVAVLAFLLARSFAAGVPLAYPFDRPLNLSSELFTLPGDAPEGFPEFLPGPGLPLRVWHALVLVAGAAVVGVIAVGVGMARGTARLHDQAKLAEKASPAWPSREVAEWEPKLREMIAHPPLPRRLSGMDQFIILIFVVIIGLVLAWVIPGMGQAFNTDAAVQATQIASLWTPTPTAGPTPTLGPAPDVLFAQLPAGDPAAGKTVTEVKGCVACHVNKVEGAELIGAPWLASLSKDGKGVSEHAQERWSSAGYTGRAISAESYLYESIRNSSVFLVPGYQNLMPTLELTDQELADVIAYLLTLR